MIKFRQLIIYQRQHVFKPAESTKVGDKDALRIIMYLRLEVQKTYNLGILWKIFYRQIELKSLTYHHKSAFPEIPIYGNRRYGRERGQTFSDP